MSPEYSSIREVPRGLVGDVKSFLEKNGNKEKYPSLVDSGFGFYLCNGGIKRLLRWDDLSDTMRSEGRKENSNWHIVRGFRNTAKDGRPIEGEPKRSHGKSHRGKHRSECKHDALMEFLNGVNENGYRRYR